MPTKTKMLKMFMIVAVAAIAFQPADALRRNATTNAGAGAKVGPASDDPLYRAKTLRAAADALGMVRWSDIGAGSVRLPAVDAVNTMEIWATGTTYDAGQAYKTEYHAAIGYNPPAMRVEMTRTPAQGSGAAQHTIQVVREKYAWDESEIGAGLVPGKGTATPAMSAVSSRLLQLWILPYGVLKAALAAGDKTKISTENGSAVVTFPLGGLLADVMVKATLDANHEVARVETRTDNPALGNMITETEYSDYADHGEIASDVKSPGHIVQKQGGHPVLDIQLKMVDANNPYLVFPIPENVKKAAIH